MHHQAKKSLGQNFLKSKDALRRIIEAAQVSNTDIILEIGPGKGALTEMLVAQAGKVIAIEKDRDLIGLLHEKFSQEITSGKLEVLEGDILEFNPDEIKKYTHGLTYKIVANIPYYITGAIFKQFLSAQTQPERMVVLVQKEVAERIATRDGKESILSLSVKIFGIPKYIKTVQAKYFSPAPNVDSAILLIEHISRKNLEGIAEERFFELVKTGFAHKRKMLIKNIKDLTEKNLNAIFEEVGVSKTARAEDVPLEQWLRLTYLLF